MRLSCNLFQLCPAHIIWDISQCHQYISYCPVFHQHYLLVNVWTAAFCCQRDRTCPLIQGHQRENIKLIFHSAPTPVRQIYVDIPSINGWKIDGIWCPRVEHEAAGGSVDTSAIFGRSLVLSVNLVGQPTHALLHASVWFWENGRQRGMSQERPISATMCVKFIDCKK